MSSLWQVLQTELQVHDGGQFVRITFRLLMAVVLGGILGIDREQVGKAAGLRTHMLVSLGAALFVLVPAEMKLMANADVSRIVQGVAAGIGFLGAGTILKLSEKKEIHGLTTAAGIWLTAAVGVAIGLGQFWPALIGVILAWTILVVLRRFEKARNKNL